MTTRAALGAIILALASSATAFAELAPRAALVIFACSAVIATLAMAWVPARLNRASIERRKAHKRAA